MSWLPCRLVAPAVRPRRVVLPLGLSRTINGDLVQVTWGRRSVARGPPLALTRAVPIGLLGLIVQEHHVGRERQVDASMTQRLLNGLDHPPTNMHHLGALRLGPPAH